MRRKKEKVYNPILTIALITGIEIAIRLVEMFAYKIQLTANYVLTHQSDIHVDICAYEISHNILRSDLHCNLK